MNLLELFRIKKKSSTTAAIAKERLQIIVSHERAKKTSPDYLPKLQREIVEVIAKYVQIDQDLVHVNFQNIGECSILELNITLPDLVPEEVA